MTTSLAPRLHRLAIVVLLALPPLAQGSEIVTGTDAGTSPHVKVFDGGASSLLSFFAYSQSFTGGVRVGAGDVNGDGVADLITGPGPGGGSHVKVFNGMTDTEMLGFFAFPTGFTGGVFVSAGDVNGDGQAEIIVGAGEGGGQVKVFPGGNIAGALSFFPYGSGFTGGVRVGAGDVNGDGVADIITGVGQGFAPHVKVFDGTTNTEIFSFFAFPVSFTGGIFVSGGDVNGDGYADIIVGADAGAGHVKVFDGQSGTELLSFFPYGGFTGGVRVGAGDLTGDGVAEIITGTGPGAMHVKVFTGAGDETGNFLAYPSGESGIYVAGHAIVPEPVAPYQQWAELHFPGKVTPELESSVWGPLADPNHDDQVNLIKYALGLDPHDASGAGEAFTAAIGEDGGLTITFIRRTNDPTLTIEPQSGHDLQEWRSGPKHLKQGGPAVAVDAEHEQVTYNDLDPDRTGSPRFIRLLLSVDR